MSSIYFHSFNQSGGQQYCYIFLLQNVWRGLERSKTTKKTKANVDSSVVADDGEVDSIRAMPRVEEIANRAANRMVQEGLQLLI